MMIMPLYAAYNPRVKVWDGTDTVDVTSNSELNALDSDFFVEVNKGNVSGSTMVRTFFHDDTVGITRNTLWQGGGDLTIQTADQAVELLSADADDTSAGAGARTVFIAGLDDTFTAVSEVVVMDGATPVDFANQYMRIETAIVLTAGASGFNEGLITIRIDGAGATMGVIGAEDGIMRGPTFTVPAGKTAYMTDYLFFTGRNTDTTFYLTTISEAGVETAIIPFGVYQSAHGASIRGLFAFPEKTTFLFTAQSSVANQDASAATNWLVVDN